MERKISSDEKAWTLLQPHARSVIVNQGEYIYRVNQKAIGMFFLLSGKIKLFIEASGGREVVFQIVKPGHTFGETALFHGETCPSSAIALTESRLLFLSKRAVQNLFRTEPFLANQFLPIFARRHRVLISRITSMITRDVPERLAGYICQQVKHGTPDNFKPQNTLRLEISREILAGILGTSRESISRAFTHLAQLELISVQGKFIHILSLEKLTKFAHL